MTIPTNPYVYIPNTLAQSAQVNASFNGIYGWANGGIDDTNLNHLVGIYASTITANSTATSKFGTNPASTVGFQFIAPAANLTPLIVSGINAQSASTLIVNMGASQSVAGLVVNGAASITGNIFEADLTSGGTKAFGVNSAGSAFVGTQIATGAILGDLTVAESATLGSIFLGNGTAAQTSEISGNANTISLFPQSSLATSKFAISTTNANAFGVILTASPGTYSAPTTSAGDGVFQRSSTTGLMYAGGSGSNGSFDWNISNVGAVSIRSNNLGSYPGLFSGAYTNASDAAFKTDIATIPHGTDEIMALKPSAFTVKENGLPGLGFIAQDVQAVLPSLVIADKDGMLGVCYDGIIPVLVKAFQEMAGKLQAAGVAGF